jgi:hypothetical protein
MLTYLLGDVSRIFAGHMEPGKMAGRPVSRAHPVAEHHRQWPPVIFDLVGLPYKGACDDPLIGVSLVFSGIIIWCAWGWQSFR